LRLLHTGIGAINVITMSKERRITERVVDQAVIQNTPELRAALVHAAIGLGFDRAGAAGNANEAEDRAVGKVLADLARQLGADL
jgi:hypothetical protein